jgi:hypothetical protein
MPWLRLLRVGLMDGTLEQLLLGLEGLVGLQELATAGAVWRHCWGGAGVAAGRPAWAHQH